MPEKNTKQYNFCFIPRFTSGSGSGQAEAILFTVNHGPLKSCKIDDEELRKVAPGPEDVLENALGFVLGKSGNGAVSLTLPSEEEFASATRESHRKSDVAYHVKAFRGSKEGEFGCSFPCVCSFNGRWPMANGRRNLCDVD